LCNFDEVNLNGVIIERDIADVRSNYVFLTAAIPQLEEARITAA
jgi:hypothetical protein